MERPGLGGARQGKSELEEPNSSAVDHKVAGQSGELTWKGSDRASGVYISGDAEEPAAYLE